MTESEWLTSEDPAAILRFATHADHNNAWHHRRMSDRKLRLFACAVCRQVWPLLTDEVQCVRCSGSGTAVDQPQGSSGFLQTCPDCDKGRVNRSQRAVEAAEHYADGEATERELDGAYQRTVAWTWQSVASIRDYGLASHILAIVNGERPREVRVSPPPAVQADLLRCIVGNPFRPLPDVSFLQFAGAPLRRMAEVCYAERVPGVCERCGGEGDVLIHPEGIPFSQSLASLEPCPVCAGTGRTGLVLDPDNLAVLADALEEAGCPAEVECSCQKGDHPGHVWTGIMPALWKTCPVCDGTGRVPNPLLQHLRSPGPHVRGCWAIDLLTGKE